MLRKMIPVLVLVIALSGWAWPSRSLADAPSTDTSQPAGQKIAVFRLRGPVLESPQAPDIFSLGQPQTSLRQLTSRIRKAAEDENIQAIVIIPEEMAMGPAQIEELRQAIDFVRSKRKDVYVHADSLLLSQYLLASSASHISVVPTGVVLIPGLHGEEPYLRGLLDKIGVKPDFIHMGAYKSASEIFMRTGPSPEADAMTNWLFDSIYASITDAIAQGRKVSQDKVKSWIDQAIYSPEQAQKAGLIDAVESHDAFEQMLKKKFGEDVTFDHHYGEEKPPQVDFSNPFAFFKILGDVLGGKNRQAEPTGPAVGIVYVDGMILPGARQPSLFGAANMAYSSDIRRALQQAADDDSIKAVVLRVDSPGGSATASEIIFDAASQLKKKKPLVVSMGNVAGSGGYYVSLAADTIFADNMTLTASIGVVGGKIATTDMWNKIGITFKSYNRGKNADLLATDNVWTDAQRQAMTQWMQSVYDVFKQHVMDSRGQKLTKPLDDIAGGRVYTGKQALDLGLIDKIGTLQDAIAFAAGQAKLGASYDVRVIPKPLSPIEELLRQSSGQENQDRNSVLGGNVAGVRTSASPDLLKMAAPYLQHMDPSRLRAIRMDLMQLQLLSRQNVIMTMPAGVWCF